MTTHTETVALVERLPVVPDDDSDFTPDLARKIIAAYQTVIFIQQARIAELEAGQEKAVAAERVGGHFGIIDPDYGRVFTIARCIAWSEGYALVMHGSFTRDLDLLAVPWTERATDAEHLVRRIAGSLDELNLLVKDASGRAATEKPHGRLAWTLTFKAFGDPRFVDLSVMPRARATTAETEGG